jgi:hypothetical protein
MGLDTEQAGYIATGKNKAEIRTMLVKRVVREHDRTLLYGDNPDYHVIAKRDELVEEGDSIEYEYESCNFNFGWFSKKS